MHKLSAIVAMSFLVVSCSVSENHFDHSQSNQASDYRQENPVSHELHPRVTEMLADVIKIASERPLDMSPAPAFEKMKFTLYANEFTSEVVFRHGNVSILETNGRYGKHYEIQVGHIPLSSLAPAGMKNRTYAPRRLGSIRRVTEVFDVKRPQVYSERKIDGVSPSDLAINYKTTVELDGVQRTHLVSIRPKRGLNQHVSINGKKFLLKTIQLEVRDEEYETRLVETALVDYVPIIGAAHAASFMWYSWNKSRAIGTWSAWEIEVTDDVLRRVIEAEVSESL